MKLKRMPNTCLTIQFHKTIEAADWRPMAEIAPLVRREVEIDPESNYTELGIRSFYKRHFSSAHYAGCGIYMAEVILGRAWGLDFQQYHGLGTGYCSRL